jgi:hypothetical protein
MSNLASSLTHTLPERMITFSRGRCCKMHLSTGLNLLAALFKMALTRMPAFRGASAQTGTFTAVAGSVQPPAARELPAQKQHSEQGNRHRAQDCYARCWIFIHHGIAVRPLQPDSGAYVP